ncbi:MAG: hypothetical protein ONB44_16240 [candidate division KSB1 bacterium]|nr:hypothetical protein [candidate division KSB1 bacterium]MDZ7303683.1 hypothetical protein [candidate division KSB1 bacterium]
MKSHKRVTAFRLQDAPGIVGVIEFSKRISMIQQRRLARKFSGKITSVFGIFLLAILSIAWHYGEDLKTKNTAAHSTFHWSHIVAPASSLQT